MITQTAAPANGGGFILSRCLVSIEVMTAIFKADPEELSSTEKLVLLALADHGNDEGRHIYPSISKLAVKTSLSDRAVQVNIGRLKDRGFLEHVGSQAKRRTNEYAINVDLLISLGRTEKPHEKTNSTHPEGERDSPTNTPRVNVIHPEGERDSPESLINPLKIAETKFETPLSPSEIWQQLSGDLYQQAGRAFFDSWIAPAVPVAWDGKTLQVSIGNRVARDMLDSRFGSSLNRSLPALVNQPDARVEFIVQGAGHVR